MARSSGGNCGSAGSVSSPLVTLPLPANVSVLVNSVPTGRLSVTITP